MNQGKRAIRRLRRILKKVIDAEKGLKETNFQEALIELRKAFQKQKQFYKWLKEGEEHFIELKGFSYGKARIEEHFAKAEDVLARIAHYTSLNEKQHTDKEKGLVERQEHLHSIEHLLKELHHLIIWEIHNDEEALEKNMHRFESSQTEAIRVLKKADKRLTQLIKRYGLADPKDFVDITNQKEEKEKFFKALDEGRTYNPHFHHNHKKDKYFVRIEKEAAELIHKLRTLHLDFSQGAAHLVLRKRYNLRVMIECIRSLGTADITKHSIRLFGEPDTKLINESRLLVKRNASIVQREENERLDKKRYNAKRAKKLLDRYFKHMGMDWKTVLIPGEKMSVRWQTNNLRKELRVNRDAAPFSHRDLLKCMKHEIGVHATRVEKGSRAPLRILEFGTAGYLITEEGMTGYLEEVHDLKDEKIEKLKYVYVVSEWLAQRQGFYDCFVSLFNELYPEGTMSQKEFEERREFVWRAVYRIKLGLSNTAQKGGYMKDHVYFVGDRKVGKYLTEGGALEDLEQGKIRVEDVPYLTGKWDVNQLDTGHAHP